MSSKITGPLFTKPPAVIGPCASPSRCVRFLPVPATAAPTPAPRPWPAATCLLPCACAAGNSRKAPHRYALSTGFIIMALAFSSDSIGTIPRWSAAVAACVRSVTPSLPSRLLMCVFTVASEISSSVAISLLLLPLTICSSTSTRAASAPRCPCARPASRQSPAEYATCPACTVRIVADQFVVVMPFSRYAARRPSARGRCLRRRRRWSAQ
jgi:hypothetical protein